MRGDYTSAGNAPYSANPRPCPSLGCGGNASRTPTVSAEIIERCMTPPKTFVAQLLPARYRNQIDLAPHYTPYNLAIECILEFSRNDSRKCIAFIRALRLADDYEKLRAQIILSSEEKRSEVYEAFFHAYNY
jgi:hypothetical protein